MTRITEERLENIFNDLIEELGLNYGNGGFDCLEDNERFIGYIEAPNNTTLMIDIDFDLDEEMTDEEIKDEFIDAIKDAIYYFDPENTFEEVWSPNFEIKAFRFVEMLKEDEEFFDEVADEL